MSRRKRVADWLRDLFVTLHWYMQFGVWAPPTRRWAGPKGSLRWPLPDKRRGKEV